MDIKQILMTFNALGNNNLAMTGTTGISESDSEYNDKFRGVSDEYIEPGVEDEEYNAKYRDNSCGKLDHEFEEDEVTGQKKCVKCGEEFLDELEVDDDEKLREGMFSNIFSKKQGQFEELLSKKGFDDNGLKNIGEYKINVLADDKKQNFIVRVSLNNRPLKKFHADSLQELDEIIGGAFSFVHNHQEELVDDEGVQTMLHGPTKSERRVLNLESKNKPEDEIMNYKNVDESIKNFSKNLMEKLAENECEKCSGDGCVPCQACKGHEGNKKCKECKGEGEITCGSCGGSGSKKSKKKIKESGEIVGNAQGSISAPVPDSFNVSVSQSNYNGELIKNITVSASGNKADEIADLLKLSGILTGSTQPISAELPIDYDEVDPEFESNTPVCDLCAQTCSDDCTCDCHHDVKEDYDHFEDDDYVEDDVEDDVYDDGICDHEYDSDGNFCLNCGEPYEFGEYESDLDEASENYRDARYENSDHDHKYNKSGTCKICGVADCEINGHNYDNDGICVNCGEFDDEELDESSHPDIPGSDDYCDACSEEVSNHECGHGILCDKCERDIHGEEGVCDADEGFVRESKNITSKKNVKEAWANEPNEKISHWRALIDDADGPNNPKDMYPNRLGDNPLKVAKNKKNKEIHEMSEKLSQKFKSFTLSEGKKKLTAKDKNKGIDDCGKKKVTGPKNPRKK